MKQLINSTYRQKFKWVAFSILPALLLCYYTSISKTVTEYRLYKRRQQSIEEQAGMSGGLEQLSARKKKVETLLLAYRLDTLQQGKALLPVITELCRDYQLRLKEYRPAGQSSKDSIGVVTRMVSVEGSFMDCLQLVYALERHQQVGRVGSVSYKAFRESQDGPLKLNCTIYLQNIN